MLTIHIIHDCIIVVNTILRKKVPAIQLVQCSSAVPSCGVIPVKGKRAAQFPLYRPPARPGTHSDRSWRSGYIKSLSASIVDSGRFWAALAGFFQCSAGCCFLALGGGSWRSNRYPASGNGKIHTVRPDPVRAAFLRHGLGKLFQTAPQRSIVCKNAAIFSSFGEIYDGFLFSWAISHPGICVRESSRLGGHHIRPRKLLSAENALSSIPRQRAP